MSHAGTWWPSNGCSVLGAQMVGGKTTNWFLELASVSWIFSSSFCQYHCW